MDSNLEKFRWIDFRKIDRRIGYTKIERESVDYM